MGNAAGPPLGGMGYQELHGVGGLERLDTRFLEWVRERAPDLHRRLLDYREASAPPASLTVSELLLAIPPYLEDFIGTLFGIERELAASRASTLAENRVPAFKKAFVLARARHYRRPVARSFEELDVWLDQEMAFRGIDRRDREGAVAQLGLDLLQDETGNAGDIESLTQWCALGLTDPVARARVAGWSSFRLPQRVQHAQLVPRQAVPDDPAGRMQGDPTRVRRRDGFGLTDRRMSAREVQDQVAYCIYCHDHEGDFCARGFPEKKGHPELGLKVDPLGVTLTGCPLEEKISEMQSLKRDGHTVGALAVAMLDNPMVPATGHRICNDCMKGCVYQKQEPVDVPQIETRVLTDVLALPWGVEIYDLLTRWNPLRRRQYLPRPYNGRKVLIAGMGPAGFTMAHHLTMEGCAVVGVEGLKVEPLPEALLGAPVRDWQALVEELDERVMAGFGGVAEYGITVRWDKNFLKLIYLTLARRPLFQVFGGVRLGGTLTLEDAWALGFDHVCVATGAGLPRVLAIGNSLARGMRQASDFLMALQLTGAAKGSSLASLQVRLPALVIGGGLTAIDTATEVQAYYIKQVEKVVARCERLKAVGRTAVPEDLDEESQAVLAEFLEHGRAVRAERVRAAAAGEAPNFLPLIRQWGGVTIVYRRGLNESPAYVRNHEEVVKALEEGIYYLDGLEPLRVEVDGYGHVEALVCRPRKSEDGRWLSLPREVRLPARAVFVAAGATPNTIYEREHPDSFALDGTNFLPHVLHRDGLQPVQTAQHCKATEFGPFTSYERDAHRVSFIGDTHPVFHGSVVKAIASAQRAYPEVMEAVEGLHEADPDPDTYARFREHMTRLLTARVARAALISPAVLELWVEAPMAARNFRAGQFFRLQNYERLAPEVEGTRLQTGPLTVSGAGVDGGRIRLLVLQGSVGARVCTTLREGDPVVLMGPTGAPAGMPENGTVMVAAGMWGAAVMLALGPALRAAGNRILFFALHRSEEDISHRDELEAAADRVVWCTPAGPTIQPRRPQDLTASGDLIDVLRRYEAGELGGTRGPDRLALADVDQMVLMGIPQLGRLRDELKGGLAPLFREDMQAIASVGSPMQCMLKGVCAQCLQWQIDPETGKRTRAVFSCAEQDQPLGWIDLENMEARMRQNTLPDRLSSLWLDHLFEASDLPRS